MSFNADNVMWMFYWHERITTFLSDGECQKLKMRMRASYPRQPYNEGSDIPLSRRPCSGRHLALWPKNDYNKGRSVEASSSKEEYGCSSQNWAASQVVSWQDDHKT